jgi:DNA-binding transcriptional LysR family regulator
MRVTARAASMESRLMLILTGRYIGFLPCDFARSWVERGDIRALAMPGLAASSTGYAVFRRDAAPSAGRDLFLADLTRAFKPLRPPAPESKSILSSRPKTVFQPEAGAA